MSEVEEAPEELIEGETPETETTVEDVAEEEVGKGSGSSPNELKVLVDVIELIRRALKGEINEEKLQEAYDKIYSKT